MTDQATIDGRGGGIPPHLTPRQRLAAALRPLIDMTVASILDDDAVTEAAVSLEALGERLRGQARPGRRPIVAPDMSDPLREFFPSSPIVGTNNPLAPPVRLTTVPGVDGGWPEIAAEANFGYPYEGPPTCVHGGVIAETFDEVMGAANMVSGNPGMTGTLTIRYRRPTPLRADLRIEARCLGRSGRKISTWAGIYFQGQLTAEAEGVFIEVGPTHLLSIAEANPGSVDPQTLELLRHESAASDPPTGNGANPATA
jgi:Thioesterase superfamily